MDSSDLMQLVNKCTNDECIKTVSQNYMLSQIFCNIIYRNIYMFRFIYTL